MPAKTTLIVIVMAALLIGACAPVGSQPSDREPAGTSSAAAVPPAAPLDAPLDATASPAPAATTPQPAPDPAAGRLPLRYQRPAYYLQEESLETRPDQDHAIRVPVGADIISATGPVPLRGILRRLADLKNMTLSWASDVDPQALVDVDIRAEDDFFTALDNLLQQQEYYYELRDRVIQVKFRETRRFHVPIPFMNVSYRTGVGGEVQGSGGLHEAGGGNPSNINQILSNNDFDIWANISQNLDQILGIWEQTVTLPQALDPAAADGGQGTTTERRRDVAAGQGFYSIDKPVGLITVTAPRLLVRQIEEYLNSLTEQIFKQVTIEAKIIEVILQEEHRSGIDWAAVLSGKRLDFQLFGPDGIIYPSQPDTGISQIAIGPNPFTLLLEAIETQGDTNVLSNPRISIMNGQPALINVGETRRFISEVSTTTDGDNVTTSVTTDTVMSGLSMSVLPIITPEGEIILSMTPVTTQLGELLTESFGPGGEQKVQLPQMNIREMHTMVRIKSGDTLMIGGLIDEKEETTSSGVPGLRNVPGIGKLFGHERKHKDKRELVILLQPRII